jgi:phage-related minor tail protein
MLDLSTISFKVDTSELDRAGKAIGELVTNVGKLDKAARDAAQTEATLARAAKDNAKANLDNAKAQDVRLKSTITADKADQQATAAIEKKTKATEKVNEVVNKNVGVLQRQKDILEFQTQGFSKGQSSILAYAKAAGLAAEDIGELGKVLETQRKLMGGDPFDKSLSGLKSLQNQYTELKESVRQYATDSNLTAKQTRELARDKERLIEKMKVEGASFSEIRQAVRAHNAEYVNLATSYNKMTSAEDAVIKSRKEAVNATNYLTQADQKMAAALNTSNAALDKAGTDSLVKYESALRKSGVSQDVATQKLATYKAQLAQVAAVEEKRRAQHLTRALTPQISDVAVSLWSGQSPLTVLLQQGAQVNDMFQLSGVAAADFGKTVKEAFSSMLPSIRTVVKGVGGLIVDGLIAAGNATQGFIAGIFGMTGAMDKLYMKLSENGPSKFGGMIQTISSIMTGVFAVGVGVVIAGLAMMAKGAYDSMIAVSDLNKAMVLGGNAFNMTGAQALAYADTLSSANVSTLGIIEVMTEMSKVGGFTADQIGLVSRAAIAMQDYAGVAIKDTVKQFSELGKDPVKALLELSKKTGELTVEQIKSVEQLQKQGRSQDAVNLAMKISAGVMDKQSQSLRDQLHPLEKLVAGWKILGRWMWDVTNIAPGTSDALELINKKERLAKSLAAGVSENVPENVALKQEIALLEAKTLTQAQSAANRQAVKDEAAAYQQFSGALSEFDKQLNKADASKMRRQDFINAKIQELGVLENAGKYESTTLNTDRIKQFFKVYGEEWDKAQEKLGSKEANYFATLMREATNNTIAANTAAQELTKSEQKLLEVRSDPRFEKLTATQKQDVISKYEAAIAAEKQTALTEKLADAEERLLRLLGKSSGIGRQYYTDMANMEKDAALLGKSREEIEELTRAIFMATPAWKDYEKALEDVNSAARKFNEDSLASQAATLKENESLDYRLSLLGKTAEEQRALSIEYNRANKLREVDIKLAKQLREIEEKIAKAKKDGLPESDYQSLIDAQVQARKDAAEQEKAINREVAVQYAEDLQKEFDAIKNGISDSIVTALFEGGKAGSKKFRDLVMAELRKPVTMVVNAVVNTVLGSLVGNLLGGATASAAGSAGGSLLGSLGGSVLTSAGSSLLGMTAFTTGLGNIGTGVSLGLGLGSSTAAASAAAAAGGATTSAGLLSGIGNAIAAVPVWGWIAAGLGAIATMLDDSGTLHTGGASRYSRSGGLTSGNSGAAFDIGFGQVETGKETISAMETLSKSLVEIFDGIAKTFGKTAGYEVAVAFADDTSKDGAWGAFGVRLQGVEILNWDDFRQSKWAPKEFGDGEEGYKQYLAAIAKDTRQVLLNMDLPSWADQILTDLGESASIESLSTAIQQIGVIKGVFNTLTTTLVELSGASDETLAALMTLSGGIEALRANATTYYQNFYSAEEQRANVQKQLAKSFKELGLSMIDIDATDARQQFRDLVEAQDLTTESGREVYAALLAIAGTFASVTTEVTGSITTVADALNALRNETRSVEDIARNILSLEQAVFESQNSGNIEVLRNNILQGLTEQERVLQRQLWAIEDTRTAQDKLVSAYKGQVTALDSSINRLRTYSDSLKKFKDSLTLGELSPLTPSEQYAEAKRQYESNLALAMVGDVGAQNALQGSITAFLQASRTYNASSSQYTSDFNTAQAGLDFIASITQDQANNEQILRDAAVSQLELLGSIDESVTAVGELISSGFIELSNAILTGLSLGITPNQGVLDAVNNGLGGGQSSYYSSLHTTKSQSNQPIAIIPVNQASAMQSDSQGLVSLNSQLVEEVRNLTAQVILLRSERQQDTRSQTQILATATTEAGTAVTEAINKSNYTQQVISGAKLN